MKRALNIIVWTAVGFYLVLVVLLHIPATQSFMGTLVSDALSEGLGTNVSVGRVDLGFVNRLIVDDVYVYDQKGKQMLRVARLSAKIDPLALFEDRLSFSSIQLFGMRANLYQETPDAKPNYQFVLDSLSSDNNDDEPSSLNLQVNSIVIRHGSVFYRRLYKTPSHDRFSLDDFSVSDISSHVILNRLTNDSLNVRVKSMSFVEKSGFCLKSLKMELLMGRKNACLRNFRMELPHSVVDIENVSAIYQFEKDSLLAESLRYNGGVAPSTLISPTDFSCFFPFLKNVNEKASVDLTFSGTVSAVQVRRFQLLYGKDIISLYANGTLEKVSNRFRWHSHIAKFSAFVPKISEMAQSMGKSLPEKLNLLGKVSCRGDAEGIGDDWHAQGSVTSDIGEVKCLAQRMSRKYSIVANTDGLMLGTLFSNERLGLFAAQISATGYSVDHLSLDGTIKKLEYNGHLYQDIRLSGNRVGDCMGGKVTLDDPCGRILLSGAVNVSKKSPSLALRGLVRQLSPKGLRLSEKWGNASFDFDVSADLRGKNINSASGNVKIVDFLMHRPEEENYAVDSLMLQTGYKDGCHFLSMNSDFGRIDINGHFDYTTLPNSIIRIIGSKLPTIPGLPKVSERGKNDFEISMRIDDSRWMQYLLGIPLIVNDPLTVNGGMDDSRHNVDLTCKLPDFLYAGAPYKGVSLHVSTPSDTLVAVGELRKIMSNGRETTLSVYAGACENKLSTSIAFKNNERHPLSGILNASTQFRRDAYGRSTAFVEIAQSSVSVGDSTWHISPSTISYRKNYIDIHDFCIRHDNQYVSIDGTASSSADDSLQVSLNGIDVRYVLDLINFHSVDFDGAASGRGYVAAIFSKHPQASAELTVDNFLFEGGRMGTLSANISYGDAQQIDIVANAKDGDNRNTFIEGYVSPTHGTIDLNIQANRTRLEFMESFCGSFMRNVEASADGAVRLSGKLSNINLTGQLVVDGSLAISSLNTTYTLQGDTVRFVPDEIIFSRDTIYDRNGNVGIVDGSIHHKHLTNLSYDLGVKAKNLLSYDTHTFGENTFYGTAYVTGDCFISGRSGEVNIDINATPCPGCIIVYNVNDRGDLSSHEFLHWVRSHKTVDSLSVSMASPDRDETDNNNIDDENVVSTNIRLNFLVNCTPDATIKLIMDEQTGDYITLNGDGILRATYYNKGSFDIYGNYIVDHGVYKLTVQNVIKRDFEFQKGGTIAFGGNPYNADINLKAMYVLNSVSLSDLNIGKSFTSNNVRVNCLMNITGTPYAPKVDFDIDLPTLGQDAKQMVYSVINVEEEMNQQALYLLAVGRFYTQGSNNAVMENSSQYSQTSLAMQSILSGTISQQLNNVLSNVMGKSNWNIGANISTGTEGFNDAEYEGLLSGRMLNNRLLFNGQFGYRDNANATTSFIGDFDLRYLLFPNGNLSVNVYNKTNDRYFTRNTMTTQGIGIIMKKDFNGLRDLLGIKRKRKSRIGKSK